MMETTGNEPELAELQAEVYAQEAAPGQSAGTTVLALLAVLARRKKRIAEATGVAALAGVVLSLLLPVRFTATTRILTPQPTPSAAALMMSQPVISTASSLMSGAGGFSLRNPNDLYVGLLRSRPIADAILQQFGLPRVYRASNMSAARTRLADNTTITSEKSGLIAISVTDGDRARAARMANAYTDQLRALTRNLALTEASRRRIFYEAELKRATDDLTAAQLAFRNFQQQKGLVELDAQARALIGRIAQMRAEAAAREVQLQALRSYSTESNPDVEMAESQLASLRAQLAQMEQRNESSPSTAGIGLQDMAGGGLNYLRAEHELQYRQALLDLLMKQYDAARLDEAKDATIIQVVETAAPPDRKTSPHRVQVVLACAALGFFCACLYFGLGQWVRRELALIRLMIESANSREERLKS